ncbi:MAG: tetratricopeptide repeat protein [Desulfobulbaceae bacterium]|nr:tetratricopeptide repeat protein [Desulfobulbaceae bacterium]
MATSEPSGTIKKETMIMVAVATFVIGFLSGIVFSAYKTDPSSIAQQPNTSSPLIQAPANGGISAQDSGAILALEREVAVNKDNVMAWTQLGHKYFDTNQPAKAIPAYEKALELDPNVPDVWTDLGVMYRRNGQPMDALKAFDKARQIDPAHQQSRFNRGVVFLYDLKDPQSAVAAWKELLSINPQSMAPNGQPLSALIADVEKTIKK